MQEGGNNVVTANEVGTIASQDADSVNIDGGNIDGTAIGVSSASSGAFTTVDATGDVSIADKIVHTGDTDTAVRFPAADTIDFETAGSPAMRIDSSGNVGIGVTSPSQKLDVVGMVESQPLFGVTGIPATPSTSESSRVIDAGWLVASARGSWAKAAASGGNQLVAYKNGSNNDYIVWDMVLENCSQIVCDLIFSNYVDSTSRSISSEYSVDGGSTWVSLGSVTVGSTASASFGGTATFSAPTSLIYFKVRAFYTSGASSNGGIGIRQVTFNPTCTSSQWAKVLG